MHIFSKKIFQFDFSFENVPKEMDFIHHCIGNSHQKSLQSHQKLRRSSRVSRAAYNIEKWTVSQHFVKSQIRPLPLLAFLAFVNQTLYVPPCFVNLAL